MLVLRCFQLEKNQLLHVSSDFEPNRKSRSLWHQMFVHLFSQIFTLGLLCSVCCFSVLFPNARSQDFQFPKRDYFDINFLHIGGIKIHNQMDVHLPHKVGRQIQLIQHRENEYKSERVNSARVFYFIYIYVSLGSYSDSVWRLYLWFQYINISRAF